MLRRYVLARILAGVAGILVFLTAVFFATRLLMPGDFADNFNTTSPGFNRQLREALGLNQPLLNQYLIWLGRTLTFDLGQNPGGQSVFGQLMAAFPWTLSMFVLGLGGAYLVGARIGRWAGWRKQSMTPTTIGAATLTSIFPPWLVFLTFYTTLNLLGFRFFNSLTAPDFELWSSVPFSRESILWRMLGTGTLTAALAFLLLRMAPRHQLRSWRRLALWVAPLALLGWWQLTGILPFARDIGGLILLPVLVLFLLSIGDIVLVVAASMDGLADSDFALSARAKGLTDRAVRDRHAGRVALLPALSRLAANLPFALGGLVIIEASFARLGGYRIPVPGVASVLFGSLRQRDTAVILGGLVFVGVITLILRIVLDLTVAVLDPRIKLEKVVVRV